MRFFFFKFEKGILTADFVSVGGVKLTISLFNSLTFLLLSLLGFVPGLDILSLVLARHVTQNLLLQIEIPLQKLNSCMFFLTHLN